MGVGGECLRGCEMPIALNGQVRPAAHLGQLGDRDGTDFRIALPEIAKAEGHVGLFGIEFCQQPGAAGIGREELDDRLEILLGRPASRRWRLALPLARSISRVFVLYLFTREANVAAGLTTVVDALGYGPTFIRGWPYPKKDSVTSFALNGAKFVPSLMAMDPISFATSFYPATLLVLNWRATYCSATRCPSPMCRSGIRSGT